MIARKIIIFFENLGFFIRFRMLPIRLKYLDSIIEKSKNKLKKKKFKKRIFDPPSHKKTEKMRTLWAEIQAYIRTRTQTRTHARTHARTHTTHTYIFQKSCILIPNTSENNYNMFLQLKKLLSQSFLYEEAIYFRIFLERFL